MASALATSLEYQEAHINDSKVPSIIGSAVTCFVISYGAVALRIFSRRLNGVALKADDWCIIGSLVFSTASIATLLGLIKTGLGHHAIRATNLVGFQVLGLASEVAYCLTLLTIKVSTLLLLRRIFYGKIFTRILWALGTVIVFYTVTQIVFSSIQCVPLNTTAAAILRGQCSKITVNIEPALVACASMNIATDWAMFCLPIPKLWALKVSMKEKVQLIGIFLLGALVCVISIVRLPKILAFTLADATWQDADFAIWSSFELAFATLSACVPTMRPLLDGIFRRRLGPSKKIRFNNLMSSAHHRAPWMLKFANFNRVPSPLGGGTDIENARCVHSAVEIGMKSAAEMGMNSTAEMGVNSVVEIGKNSVIEMGMNSVVEIGEDSITTISDSTENLKK